MRWRDSYQGGVYGQSVLISEPRAEYQPIIDHKERQFPPEQLRQGRPKWPQKEVGNGVSEIGRASDFDIDLSVSVSSLRSIDAHNCTYAGSGFTDIAAASDHDCFTESCPSYCYARTKRNPHTNFHLN